MVISKELMSEALKDIYKIKEIKSLNMFGDMIEFKIVARNMSNTSWGTYINNISAYKIADLIKLWAHDSGYLLQSRVGRGLAVVDIFVNKIKKIKLLQCISAETEYEAVIIAGEYILEKERNKG